MLLAGVQAEDMNQWACLSYGNSSWADDLPVILAISPGNWWVQSLERKADDPAALIASWVFGSSFKERPMTCTVGNIRLIRRVVSIPPRRGISHIHNYDMRSQSNR